MTPTKWWNNDWGKVGRGFIGFITSYSKFNVNKEKKLTSLQKLNIMTKVNMDNNKLINARMTNEFFEKTWCDDNARKKLLNMKTVLPRFYFSNMNTTGKNLKIKFLTVNESK